MALIDNDTRILFTIVYDGDFKPYTEAILREAGRGSTRSFSACGMVSEARKIENPLKNSSALPLSATFSMSPIRTLPSGTSPKCSG
jgi:hypothetical protein